MITTIVDRDSYKEFVENLEKVSTVRGYTTTKLTDLVPNGFTNSYHLRIEFTGKYLCWWYTRDSKDTNNENIYTVSNEEFIKQVAEEMPKITIPYLNLRSLFDETKKAKMFLESCCNKAFYVYTKNIDGFDYYCVESSCKIGDLNSRVGEIFLLRDDCPVIYFNDKFMSVTSEQIEELRETYNLEEFKEE